MSTSNGNKRIANNTLYLSLRMLIVLIISLYTSRVVLQNLGINDFGIYNVVGGFVSMFAFLNSSLSNGIQRFFNYEMGRNGEDGARKVYNSAIRVQVIFALIIVVLTETVGLWYLYYKMVIPMERFDVAFWIFQFSVMGMVLSIMQAPFSASILAHEKMNYYAFVGILDVVLRLLIVILLIAIYGDKLFIYGVLHLFVNAIQFVMCYTYSKISFKELRLSVTANKRLIKDMLSFSGWNMFGTFAIMMKEQGVNMILNLFFGPAVNAARGVAYQVISHVRGFVSNINIAAKPQMTQSFAENNVSRTMTLMYSLSKVCFFVLFALSYPLCLEIDTVLHLWLGDNVPEYTNIFIILVFMTSFLNNLNTPVSFVVHATGNMKKYQVVTSFIELSILPISYFVLKLGAAPYSVFIVTLFVVAINQYASLCILRQLVSFSLRDYFYRVIFPILYVITISCFLPCLLRILLPESYIRFFLVCVVSVITIAASIWLCGLNKNEKELFKDMAGARIKSLNTRFINRRKNENH